MARPLDVECGSRYLVGLSPVLVKVRSMYGGPAIVSSTFPLFLVWLKKAASTL